MLWYFLSLIYFFLPAYFANMTPPVAKRLKILESLSFPLDRGFLFFGKPFFGSHKTLRGIVCQFFVGFLIVFFQRFLFQYEFFKKISILNYEKINIFLFAFLFPLGVIFGDLFFAFIKRRLNLKPGAPFLPFDQTNYVLGCALFLGLAFKIPFSIWIHLFFLTFFLHIIFNRLGYYLKIHSAKW